MRKQVELTFVIGIGAVQKNRVSFINNLTYCATELCGGCTLRNETGFWAADGAEHKPKFTGEQVREYSAAIVVTCEIHKVEVVYAEMKTAIVKQAEIWGIDIDWVHVKRVEFTGMHFSVKEQNKQSEYPAKDRWPVDPRCPKRTLPSEKQAAYAALAEASSPRDASHRSFMKYSAALSKVKDALGV